MITIYNVPLPGLSFWSEQVSGSRFAVHQVSLLDPQILCLASSWLLITLLVVFDLHQTYALPLEAKS